jgi:hypothetical protein
MTHPTAHVNPDRAKENYEIDETCLKFIEENNQKDISLYRRSKQLFCERLEKAGINII